MGRRKKGDGRLERIQLLVLKGQWELSSHVLDYIEDGEFELRDIEEAKGDENAREMSVLRQGPNGAGSDSQALNQDGRGSHRGP